jgi:hypothetical protein
MIELNFDKNSIMKITKIPESRLDEMIQKINSQPKSYLPNNSPPQTIQDIFNVALEKVRNEHSPEHNDNSRDLANEMLKKLNNSPRL